MTLPHEWQAGDVVKLDHQLEGSPENVLAIRNTDGSWTCSIGDGISHDDSNVKNVRKMLVIDPEDTETCKKLLEWYIRKYHNYRRTQAMNVAPSKVSAMRRAVEELTDTRPEVYEHVVNENKQDGAVLALCGKVWVPNPDGVKVIGRCENCERLAQVWTH